jgi:hypothetical protein
MDTWTLENETLRIEVDADTFRSSVTRKSSGLRWAFQDNADGDLRVVHGSTDTLAYLRDAREKQVFCFSTPAEERLTCHLRALPGGVGLSISYVLPHREDMLRIEVEPLPATAVSHISHVWYPGRLDPVGDETQYTLWPHGAGMMIPARHDQEIVADMSEYETQVKGLDYSIAYSWHLYQPWWGALGHKSAYMAIAETPFDFALELKHPKGGPTSTRPVWVPSMGRLAYQRTIRYYFFERAGHVALAKLYRQYAQQIGRWMPLSAKFERNAAAQRLVGSVILPVSICRHNVQVHPARHEVVSFAHRTAQVRRLRELRRERVYLHIDGWGYRGYDNQHPDYLPPCPEAGGWQGLIELSQAAQECGYLFGLHDQYRDYYFDSPAFAEKYAVKDQDSGLPQWSRWAGGPQSLLCAKEMLPFLRHNYAQLRGHGVHLTASYLDVFSMNPLDECYDPRHPTTREDTWRCRAKAFEFMRSLGMAVSSEEPADCFVPDLDFVHWNGYPRDPNGSGGYWGIPVPLHALVYHDALLVPAHFDYGHSSDKRAQRFLEGLSQVQIPYGNIDWDHREQFAQVDVLAQLHEAWATHELLDHRLLDVSGRIQEFEYPEGRIVIDLEDLRYKAEGGPVATDGWVDVSTAK